MIINEDLWQKTLFQKTYLVYLLSACEMETEGVSGWEYYAVAHGNSDEEIYNDWIEQCKILYGVDLSNDLKHNTGVDADGNEYDYWSCYYRLAKNELPSFVYGDSQPLNIEKCYRKYTI